MKRGLLSLWAGLLCTVFGCAAAVDTSLIPLVLLPTGSVLPATTAAVLANTSASAVAYTLPKSTAPGVIIQVVDNTGNASVNNITISPPSGGTINNSTTNQTIAVNYGGVAFTSKGGGVFLMSDILSAGSLTRFSNSSATVESETWTTTTLVTSNLYVTNLFIGTNQAFAHNFNTNQFSTNTAYTVSIKNGATVTNLVSWASLVSQNKFSMAADSWPVSATLASQEVESDAYSWITCTSDSAVAGARIVTLAAGTYNGQMLVVKNDDNGNTFLIEDGSAVSGGGTVKLNGADWQAGQNEAMLLIFDSLNGNWSEVGRFGTGTSSGFVANLTPGYLPYAVTTNTLGDSPLYRVSTNKLGLNSTAPFLISVGNQNVGVGDYALVNLSNGAQNNALGFSALGSVTSSSHNNAFGMYALTGTTGNRNSAFGHYSGNTNVTGNDNVFFGYYANSLVNTDTNAIVIGSSAVGPGSNTATIGNTNAASLYVGKVGKIDGANYNVVWGRDAGKALTSGQQNVFIGGDAGKTATTESENTAIGNDAMATGSGYFQSVAVGTSTLYNGGGGGNTAIGNASGQQLTSGIANNLHGFAAGQYATSGSYNFYGGNYAGMSNVLGNDNVFIGHAAAQASTNTINSVFIGSGVNTLNAAGVTNVIAIGHAVSVASDNRAQIGTNGVSVLLLNGTVGWYRGSGTPEGAVAATVGSFYSNETGGAGTSFYVKESGTGNTGWVAK